MRILKLLSNYVTHSSSSSSSSSHSTSEVNSTSHFRDQVRATRFGDRIENLSKEVSASSKAGLPLNQTLQKVKPTILITPCFCAEIMYN
jgi:hypothetical protein